ncbi:hypothetical protein Rhow_008819 [Rhodococcus wratislaviensis]|uniref:Uncharacterized protein n=1 Tax=Rhodococcus wratislaviensis TaxID=44752 RepID=A0A402CLM4_RHOWR|nr:hypothetical protein Rhow_008819 [Rhodococcus wratislaviensis]
MDLCHRFLRFVIRRGSSFVVMRGQFLRSGLVAVKDADDCVIRLIP